MRLPAASFRREGRAMNSSRLVKGAVVVVLGALLALVLWSTSRTSMSWSQGRAYFRESPRRTDAQALSEGAPFPGSHRQDEIIANLIWSLQRHRGMDDVLLAALRANSVTIHRCLMVQTETAAEDYYLLEIDRQNGTPLNDVLIGINGVVTSVSRLDQQRLRKRLDLEGVREELERRFDARNIHYYGSFNNLQGSGDQYEPLLKADSPRGTILIALDRDVYLQGQLEPIAGSGFEATANPYVRRKGRLLYTREGAVELTRIGRLLD
jgi:hypothetical protein